MLRARFSLELGWFYSAGPAGDDVSIAEDLGLWHGGVYQSGQENTQTTWGGGHAVTASSGSSGTLSDATGIYNRYETTTSLANSAGFSTTSNLKWTSLNALPDIVWVMKTGPLAADIANLRMWFYLTSDNFSDGTLDAALSLKNGIAFRFNPTDGDSTWKSYTSDATPNTELQNTGVPVTVDTRYVLRAKVVSLTEVRFYVTTGATLTAADVKTSHTVRLPVASTGLTAGIIIINKSAGTARRMYWRLFGIQSK